MSLPKIVLLALLICSQFTLKAQISSDKIITENAIKSFSIDSIKDFYKKFGSLQNIETGFDAAIKMSGNKQDSSVIEKGVNLQAVLAKVFSHQVENNNLDLDNHRVITLLERFQKEKYYIPHPKIHPFIKLMTYCCQKEYKYVHKTLITKVYYRVLLVFLSICLFIFILTFSTKWHWKYKLHYRRFFYFTFLFVIMVLVFFYITCEENINDYSFYGMQFI